MPYNDPIHIKWYLLTYFNDVIPPVGSADEILEAPGIGHTGSDQLDVVVDMVKVDGRPGRHVT